MNPNTTTEYRDLPLAVLTESATNPRRIFEDAALKELAESIRSQGVLSPLLVRPLTDQSFEIVAGARRYRAAKIAEARTVPVRIVHLTDAEVLEAQLIENLQRENVHPLEEAQGFRALLNLEEPTYSVEQIAAKTGKSPAYCVGRLKLTELSPAVVEAFSKDEIGVGHALLLARLQPAQQEEALNACFREEWMGADQKPKRILLPVRQLQVWIERNVLLILKDAPFDRENPQLVPAAGSCLDCPKRTGHNKLLFAGISENSDACSDPDCYSAKLDAHVKTTIAAKPKLIQITTAYGKPAEGSPVLQRNQYVEIRQDKSEQKRDWPEYRTCKYTTDAIIADGTEKGELRKVCAHADCPVHHPKKEIKTNDAKWKAEQEKQRKQEAIARATGLRVLGAIGEAVPVRLLKRELLFIALQMAAKLDLPRMEILAKLHQLTTQKGKEPLPKIVVSFIRRSAEGMLGRLLVEMAVLLRADSEQAASKVLAEAAEEYDISVDVISTAVSKEFAEREKAKAAKKASTKPEGKVAKKTAAA
jgi:ParB family transcriptional regulator, chromosome partitioning protein